MINRLQSLFSWKVLLVILVILISYGQTLQMYFWQDDSALIFKLQNPEGMAGSFGSGIIGHGAYKYLVTPFVPFYPLFGKEPFGYFLVGLITYAIATYFFYRFVVALLQNKTYSYYATLIFAAGYIGSDIMFRVINSWQTNIGLTLAFLTFEQASNYIRKNSVRYYVLSVFFYWAATEFVYVRSHSLIVPLLILNSFYLINKLTLKRIVIYLLTQVPFIVIFYVRYLTDEGFGGPGLVSLLKQLSSGHFEILSALFANIGNTVVPTFIQTKILNGQSVINVEDQVFIAHFISLLAFSFIYFVLANKEKLYKKILVFIALILGVVINYYLISTNPLWYRSPSVQFSGILGIHYCIVSFAIGLYLLSKNKLIAHALLLATIIIITQIFGYYMQYPTSVFATTHRYFSYSLIGYSLYLVIIVWWLRETKRNALSFALLVFVLSMHLYLGFTYQNNLVESRSYPTRNFYSRLTNYVPNISRGAGFYFDVSQASPYPFEFGDFFSVGSMPESTALAMYYDVDRYDLYYLVYFDEMLSEVYSGKIPISNLYSFYYGENGLEETTAEMRKLLNEGSMIRSFASLQEVTAKPLTPILLRFSLNSQQPEPPEQYSRVALPFEKKKNILQYLNDRNKYYELADVKSTSDWRYREIRHIFDRDIATPWQGHRIHWHDTNREEITIDLGQQINISAVSWTNWKTTLAPTKYRYLVSADGVNWESTYQQDFEVERKDNELVVDRFSANARYVKMEITKTQTNDSPAILELEVIDSKYNELDIMQALQYNKEPLSLANNSEEWEELYSLSTNIATATVSWKSNKHDSTKEQVTVPLNLDKPLHTYEVVLPAGGTELTDVKIEYSIPITASISDITVQNLSLSELESRDLIATFTKN